MKSITWGAPHLKESLPEAVNSVWDCRRHQSDSTTTRERKNSSNISGEIVYQYGLTEAIKNGALCEYYYIPHVVELTEDESQEYLKLAEDRPAASVVAVGISVIPISKTTKTSNLALFKRARLIGTVERKIERLVDLLQQEDEVKHTLVYCGDGTVEGEIKDRI